MVLVVVEVEVEIEQEVIVEEGTDGGHCSTIGGMGGFVLPGILGV